MALGDDIKKRVNAYYAQHGGSPQQQYGDLLTQGKTDSGYERNRRNQGDAGSDDWWQTYQDDTRRALGDNGPRYPDMSGYGTSRGPLRDAEGNDLGGPNLGPNGAGGFGQDAPGEFDPGQFTYDQQGPSVPHYQNPSYADWMTGSQGQFGDTQGPNLDPYQDPSFYSNGNNLPSYLRDRLNAPDIGSPDFQGQYDRYLSGARGQYATLLGDQVKRLQETAAGGNRLNSGFFDEDTGDLATRIGGDFANTAKSGALDVLGLQESDVANRRSNATSRGALALDAANFSLGAAREAAGVALDRSHQAERNRGAQRSAYEGDRTYGADRSDTEYGQSEDAFRNRRNFARTGFENDRAFGRGAYEDTRNFNEGVYQDRRNNRQDRLDRTYEAATKRSNSGYERYTGTSGNYGDLITGQLDRDTAEANARRQQRGNIIGGILGIAGKFAGAA